MLMCTIKLMVFDLSFSWQNFIICIRYPRTSKTKLVGGFNPFETLLVKMEIFPELRWTTKNNWNHMKPPPRKSHRYQESKSQTLQNPQCHCNPDQSHASNVPIVVEVHLKGLKPSEFHESPGKRGARDDDETPWNTPPPKKKTNSWNLPPQIAGGFCRIVGGELFPSGNFHQRLHHHNFVWTLWLTLFKKAHLQDWGGSCFFLTTSSLHNSKTKTHKLVGF